MTDFKRRSQAERRAETRNQVLESACFLFGKKGYADTSLGDIAAGCGVTTRPIYHYFGNKMALFSAVNDVMAERVLAALSRPDSNSNEHVVTQGWAAFLDLCDDPHFRQIVLVDGPNILGRDRWVSSAVTSKAMELLTTGNNNPKQFHSELKSRMMMAALAEAAMMIAEAEDAKWAKRQAKPITEELFNYLS